MSNFKPRLNEWISPIYCTDEELVHRIDKAAAFIKNLGGPLVNHSLITRQGADAMKELIRRGLAHPDMGLF